MANNPTQFVMTVNPPNAILRYKGKTYNGFALINHGDSAEVTQRKVLRFRRIANCHPPLGDNSLVFDTLPECLNDLILKPNFLNALRSNKDMIKQLFKSLALVGLRAYEEGVKLDTRLENIYCAEHNDFIFTKSIALPSEHVEFVNWKNEILAMYENIKKKIGDNEPMFIEYNKLQQILASSNTPRDFLSNLRSWVFWPTGKRLHVIYKLTGVLKTEGSLFITYCKGRNIVLWRQMMSQDALLAAAVSGRQENSLRTSRPGSWSYASEEVGHFLTFLRVSLGHFGTFGNGTLKTEFKDEENYVNYLDIQFNDIMGEFYEGCTYMEKTKNYNLGIDSMQFDV